MLQSAPSISSARASIRALQYPIRILAVFFLGGGEISLRGDQNKSKIYYFILFGKNAPNSPHFRRKSEVAIFRQYNSLKKFYLLPNLAHSSCE
jgi:hypothetical protein